MCNKVVEYSLTDMGRKFKPVLDSIREFGFQYIDYMGEKADAVTDH